MKTNKYLLPLAVLASSACSSYDRITQPEPTPTAVLLKEIVIPNLPSPFYHFDYDAQGRIVAASYASSLFAYDITYAAGKVTALVGNVGNRDRLLYVYDDAGRVAEVRYVDPTGQLFTRLKLAYNGQKLVGLEKSRLTAGNLVVEKTISMSYDVNGNLFELTEHRPAIAGIQDDITFVDRFENYDAGINVDGFSLIHSDFFEHVVLLPGVQLQKSNPRKQTRTGNGDNFTIDYTYLYDGSNRPTVKNGDLLYQTGAHAGEHFQTASVFTYY